MNDGKMLTPRDHDKIVKWNRARPALRPLRLIKNGDGRVKSVALFCDALSSAATGIHVKAQSDESASLPGLRIGDTIYYHAVPAGPELDPFLTALEDRGLPLGEGLQASVDRIEAPAQIRLYIAPHCPFCPQAVRKLLPLAASSPLIRLEIIDGALFKDEADAAAIQSAPTTVLDSQYRWVGLPPVPEILRLILDRDPSQLGPSALRGMIEEGNAAGLARLMVDADKVFPAFTELLTHEKWPVRLGAMACFEYLAESAPRLAARYIDPLWECFQDTDTQVRGDIAYLMGESGSREAVKHLESIIQGDFTEELKEAALEGLQSLNPEPRTPNPEP